MKSKKLIFWVSLIFLVSCIPGGFGFAYDENLTDGFCLIGVDAMQEMNLSYRNSKEKSGASGVIPETVFAVGFDKDFLILKQHPRKNSINKDITNYYIINLIKFRKDKKMFQAKIDTLKYANVFKDKQGKDSIGKYITEIYKTSFSPETPKKLTYKEFIKTRKMLKISDTLDFYKYYKELD